MNIFDIVIGAILIFGFVRGLMKGLFVEVASLISIIAGVYGAIHFSNFVGDFLAQKVSWNEKTLKIAAFAITFFIIVLVISLLGKLFTKIADFATLGILNKLLGGAFGALKFGLILSILLMIFDKANSTITFIDKEKTADSMLYLPVKDLATTLFPNLVSDIVKSNKKETPSKDN